MKIIDNINMYDKDGVFDSYSRIVEDFKDYDNVTRKQMIKEMYKVYETSENIVDLCTERELKYLKMYFDGDENYKSRKYDWQQKTLMKKYLIDLDLETHGIVPFDESKDLLKTALAKVNWNKVKKKDKINEVIVSLTKIEGSCAIGLLVEYASEVLKISKSEIIDHILNNRVFQYYVSVDEKYIESLKDNIPIAIYNDYYYLMDELDEARAKQGVSAFPNVTLKDLKSYFYNDFNMNNKTIKKFYEELRKLPFFYNNAISEIKAFALLNKDRQILKEEIASVPILKNYDLTDFFKLMDKAMDEMPSGALNGLTSNEYKKRKEEEARLAYEETKNYIPQTDANIGQKNSDQFYKLYFALLDYTNQKYQIKKGYKIYKKQNRNPKNLYEIIEKLWKNQKEIIDEFISKNPYKLNDEELEIIKEFKNGIRNIYIIARYEEEYTAFMTPNKTYMIKGVNTNVDEIIPYNELPKAVITTILPFKDHLIYDGIIVSYPIDLGMEFKKIVAKEYQNNIKYYHL